ncbi:hypothetical protein GEMRC1_009412 [Eukaryota sp. GEM-RC1]
MLIWLLSRKPSFINWFLAVFVFTTLFKPYFHTNFRGDESPILYFCDRTLPALEWGHSFLGTFCASFSAPTVSRTLKTVVVGAWNSYKLAMIEEDPDMAYGVILERTAWFFYFLGVFLSRALLMFSFSLFWLSIVSYGIPCSLENVSATFIWCSICVLLLCSRRSKQKQDNAKD